MTEPFKRFNARITKEQQKFIKDKAKKEEKTESEAHREMLEDYITRNNNKKK